MSAELFFSSYFELSTHTSNLLFIIDRNGLFYYLLDININNINNSNCWASEWISQTSSNY